MHARAVTWAVPLAFAAATAVYLALVARAPASASFAWLVVAASILGGFLVALTRSLAAVALALAALERAVRELSAAPGTRRSREAAREKTLTLRALKELEFDHRMGKLTDGDFAQMAGALRERAVRLMRELDAADSSFTPKPSPPAAPSPCCSACGTGNDGDAIFCKRCGRRLA